MRRTSILITALVLTLWQNPVAAETTTPLVPHDVGHWLNLEQRTGKLAPEIAENRQLVQDILVVERSLAKIDAFLNETRKTSGCHQLLLPYVRITREQVANVDDEGNIQLTQRKVRRDAWLPVGVCSTIDQRVVYWEAANALIILDRPRNDAGGFPRTLYALFQISAEERARWSERSERLAARGKVAKPPRFKTLYVPPGDQQILRTHDPMMGPFGAEFGLPMIAAGKLASEEPTDGLQPVEPGPHDR
jgi:hypothetical protein